MKLDSLVPSNRLFCLFKGEPKTGKDIAAHSFAIAGLLYTFDLDSRMESVVNYYKKVVPRPDIIANIEYDRFTDFFSIHRRLEELKISCPYKTIVMSSLTSLARKSMNTMLMTRAPAAKGSKGESKSRGGIILHELEDFGGEANAIMMCLDSLLVISLKFNVNVILTAHIIEPQAGAFRPMRTLLTGGKKIAAEIPVSFNEAYHFYVVTSGGMEVGANDTERRYVALTASLGTDWAATALDLPEKVDFTAKYTSGLFYEEIMKFVRSANDLSTATPEGLISNEMQ